MKKEKPMKLHKDSIIIKQEFQFLQEEELPQASEEVELTEEEAEEYREQGVPFFNEGDDDEGYF